MALTALQKGVAVLVFTGIAAPLIGLLLKRVGGGWETMGGGPFAILNERPAERGALGPAAGGRSRDPGGRGAPDAGGEIAAARAARRGAAGRRGRDRAPARRGRAPRGAEAMDAELRAEVRQLVVARNERRMREGLEPLDVEAETERQLADLIGSS